MVAPRALDSCRRPEGSWTLGTRMTNILLLVLMHAHSYCLGYSGPFSFPESSSPLTSGRKTRALGATISGMRHRCRLRSETGWAEFGYFLCYFKMVAPRALDSLPQARRIEGSGVENDSGPFVRDTSPKSIDREGLGESRTGTRQRATNTSSCHERRKISQQSISASKFSEM